MSDTKKRRTGLSATGRLVALVVGVLLFPAAVVILEPPSGWLLELLFLLAQVVWVAFAAILAGRLWDRITGSKPEEVRGRRSWSDDPSVQKLQRIEETQMLVAAVFVGVLLLAAIVGAWRGGNRTLAWGLSAMAVVGALLAWRLTKKQRPYRPRDRRKGESLAKTRRELEESMPWDDE